MEFNTKLSKLIARRKVIETRKRLNKIVQSPFKINNTLKTVYQNNVVDNNKKYIITRQDYCRNFVTINIDFISNMKYFDKGANTIFIHNINSIYDKTETYFVINTIFYNDCKDKTKVPVSSIKSILYSLKKKGFISNYKDKHNNIIKGCYVIK